MKEMLKRAGGSRHYATVARRWRAVMERDSNADGQFLFSVRTTGVYCRPSCPARRPLRENVQFHATCADAERLGFRPCKRCQPNAAPLEQLHARRVAAACRAINASEKAPTLGSLAKAAGMSQFHFQRMFKRMVGLTPKQYALTRRMELMRAELPRQRTVTEAVYRAGFGSSSRFYENAPRMLGMAPARYRRGGDGVTIQYSMGRCSLGMFLVACSEKGVCAILLGDEGKELVKDLNGRFPNAVVILADKALEQVIARIIAHVEEPCASLELPLDIRGTAFQQRVWQALREIPPGTTATYTEIAQRIGLPRAVRAVAQACAANPVAVAVPCHRVIRSGGALAGYRWGLERKRRLLDMERRTASTGR